MKQLFVITVRGKQHEWLFEFEGDPKYWDDWEEDGLDVCLVQNIIPEWVVYAGLTKIYCFLQNIFQFRPR